MPANRAVKDQGERGSAPLTIDARPGNQADCRRTPGLPGERSCLDSGHRADARAGPAQSRPPLPPVRPRSRADAGCRLGAAQPREEGGVSGGGSPAGTRGRSPASRGLHALLGGGRQEQELDQARELRSCPDAALLRLRAHLFGGSRLGDARQPQLLHLRRPVGRGGGAILVGGIGPAPKLSREALGELPPYVQQRVEASQAAIRDVHADCPQHQAGPAHLRRDSGVRRLR